MLNESTDAHHDRNVIQKPLVIYLSTRLGRDLFHIKGISDQRACLRSHTMVLAELFFHVCGYGNNLVGE